MIQFWRFRKNVWAEFLFNIDCERFLSSGVILIGAGDRKGSSSMLFALWELTADDGSFIRTGSVDEKVVSSGRLRELDGTLEL